MKKFVVMVAVALMTAMNVNAQCENLKNELSLSYGIGSTSHIGDGLGEGLGSIFSDTEFDDGTIFGPVSLEFSRHLNNPRLAIGGFISYSKWDSDILKKRGNHEKVGERKRNYLTVMPSVKWYLVNKNSFGLYTKGAVGATFYNSTQDDLAGETEKDNSTHFMYQLSFIGLEVGKQVRGFVEVGIGEQGFLQTGIKYKF